MWIWLMNFGLVKWHDTQMHWIIWHKYFHFVSPLFLLAMREKRVNFEGDKKITWHNSTSSSMLVDRNAKKNYQRDAAGEVRKKSTNKFLGKFCNETWWLRIPFVMCACACAIVLTRLSHTRRNIRENEKNEKVRKKSTNQRDGKRKSDKCSPAHLYLHKMKNPNTDEIITFH